MTRRRRDERPSLKRRHIVELADGTLGFGAITWDDCFRAAIATTLQVPPDVVPDLELTRRVMGREDLDTINLEVWKTITSWLASFRLQLLYHADDELPVSHDRWIGVCISNATDAEIQAGLHMNRAMRRSSGHGRLTMAKRIGYFGDHCLVMHRGDVLFDPSSTRRMPPGLTAPPRSPSDVSYGLTFTVINTGG